MAAQHNLPHRTVDDDTGPDCTDVPQLRRLQYFFGQMLGVQDFRSEQEYFREKLKLHNRCFHGYGTVCGLLVRGVPADRECETDEDRKRDEIRKKVQELQKQIEAATRKAQESPSPDDIARIAAWREEIHSLEEEYGRTRPGCAPPPVRPTVLVECGIAVDCEGNDIIVRRTEHVDLWQRLNHDEQRELSNNPRPVYLSICFCERPVDPVRPIGLDSCEPRPDCVYGKIQDSYSFDVSLTPPPLDQRCESCCDSCKHRCLLLARIDGIGAEGAVEDRYIDNSVRRQLARYAANRIVGINWTHGAEYSIEETNNLLDNPNHSTISNGGLVIRTERPIRVATLRPGVVDLWVIQGGGGKHADIYSLDHEIVPIQPDSQGYVSSFRIRYTGDEQLDNGDRVMVMVRGAFLLDDCCRPLDGVHVGGAVPMLPDSPQNDFERFDKAHTVVCRRDPYGPLASGYSPAGATTFESWFFAKHEGGTLKKNRHAPDRKQE